MAGDGYAQLNKRIPVALKARLEAIAQRIDRTETDIVIGILEDGLAELERLADSARL